MTSDTQPMPAPTAPIDLLRTDMPSPPLTTLQPHAPPSSPGPELSGYTHASPAQRRNHGPYHAPEPRQPLDHRHRLHGSPQRRPQSRIHSRPAASARRWRAARPCAQSSAARWSASPQRSGTPAARPTGAPTCPSVTFFLLESYTRYVLQTLSPLCPHWRRPYPPPRRPPHLLFSFSR